MEMEFDDVQLMVIQVLTGVVKLLRQGQEHSILCLKLTPKSEGGYHDFWIHGTEIFGAKAQTFSGEIGYIKGNDSCWRDGVVNGWVYLTEFRKCPFRGRHEQGRGMVISVSKDIGHAMSYGYETVGEFVI